MGYFSFEVSTDADGDGYLGLVNLRAIYEEMGIAHVGQDYVRWIIVFFIKGVGDHLIVSDPGRAALGFVSHSPILVLNLVL